MAFVNVAEARRQGYSVDTTGGNITLTKTGPAESDTKGSYIVTKSDGSQVYRKHGSNALGDYVVDRPVVYDTDSSGSYVAKETKFITTTEKEQAQQNAQDQQRFYTADNTGTLQDPKTGFYKRTEALVEREAINRAKQREIESRWGISKDPNDPYLAGFLKSVRRLPVNILYGLQQTGGRISWGAEALFYKEGRSELKKGFGRVPKAVAKAYNPLDPEGLLNIGLVSASVKGMAKPGNVGSKAYNKYFAKSDIKGGISGFQDTTVYRGTGVFKGSKIKETTVSTDAGKTSTSTINYKGETYIINRGPLNTNFKVLKGDQVIRAGSYKNPGTGLKPTLDKTSTSTQLKTLIQDPNKPYSLVDLQTITKAKMSDFNIDASKFRVKTENINIGSKTTAKTGGIVTDQKIRSVGPRKVVIENKKPIIEINKKVDPLKDLFEIKDGTTTVISQPKTFLKGSDTTIIKGSYSLKDIPRAWGKGAKAQAPGSLISETLTAPKVGIQAPVTTIKQPSFTIDRSALSFTQKGGTILFNPIFEPGKVDYYYKELSKTPSKIKEVTITTSKIYNTQELKAISEYETLPKIYVGGKVKTAEITTPKTAELTAQLEAQEILVNPVVTTSQTTRPAFDITQIPTSQPRIKKPPFLRPQIPQEPIIPRPLISGIPRRGLAKSKGYDVFVRSRGVFSKINVKPLTRSDAINFGAFRVGTTASATFKIGQATGSPAQKFQQKGFLSDFYRKDNLFIEKRGRRIKSPGEKRDITYKGLSALKRRRKK